MLFVQLCEDTHFVVSFGISFHFMLVFLLSIR